VPLGKLTVDVICERNAASLRVCWAPVKNGQYYCTMYVSGSQTRDLEITLTFRPNGWGPRLPLYGLGI